MKQNWHAERVQKKVPSQQSIGLCLVKSSLRQVNDTPEIDQNWSHLHFDEYLYGHIPRVDK